MVDSFVLSIHIVTTFEVQHSVLSCVIVRQYKDKVNEQKGRVHLG